jgi:hypothetical protein
MLQPFRNRLEAQRIVFTSKWNRTDVRVSNNRSHCQLLLATHILIIGWECIEVRKSFLDRHLETVQPALFASKNPKPVAIIKGGKCCS